jgi:CheY-like chemotaxis protein
LRIIKLICYCSKQLLKRPSKAIIHEISNGLDAVNEFENILPDIIFMDQMPLMNGYEATKKKLKCINSNRNNSRDRSRNKRKMYCSRYE